MTKIKIRGKKEQNESKDSQKPRQKPSLFQSLGMSIEEQQNIEGKLYISHYIDVFTEQTFNLIYKDKYLNQFQDKFKSLMDNFGKIREEDKLIKKEYEEMRVPELLNHIKANAETIASKKGYKKNIEQKYRTMNYILIAPLIALFAAFMIFQSFGIDIMFFALPIVCFFCLGPSYYRGSLVKKWAAFREENKNELYQLNREDLIVLKKFNNSLLENTRSHLLEKNVPLEIVKFQLFSSDYDCLKVEASDALRGRPGEMIQVVSFEYPAGIEPIPIPPELINSLGTKVAPRESSEKNFVVLSNLKIENGLIKEFVPTLKDYLAKEINGVLNECSFELASENIKEIIPNYSPELAIYCVCGELVDIRSVQICNWKDEFKFYLFEGKECSCGEKIFALSIVDLNYNIPGELKDIFLD